MNACHEDLTLWLDEDSDELIILDQTKLPGKEETVSISTARALYDAIRTLQVRGAPAIGVAAALGLYACAVRFEDETPEGFLYSLRKTKAFIASARPTAQNLFWALERIEKAADGGTIQEMPSTFIPACEAAMTSGTVDIPTASAPSARKARISAGVS